MFNEEILNLKGKIMKGKPLLEEKCVERDGMRAENAQMKNKYEKSQFKLSEFQSTLFNLEVRESEISANIVCLYYLREQIKVNIIQHKFLSLTYKLTEDTSVPLQQFNNKFFSQI